MTDPCENCVKPVRCEELTIEEIQGTQSLTIDFQGTKITHTIKEWEYIYGDCVNMIVAQSDGDILQNFFCGEKAMTDPCENCVKPVRCEEQRQCIFKVIFEKRLATQRKENNG